MEFLAAHNINKYVEKYAKNILKNPDFYETDEGYKYKAVATFRKEFNLNASDLAGMLERSLAHAHNLVQSGQYFPRKMLLQFARKDSRFVRNQLRDLLEEDGTVGFRIDRFIEEMKLKFPLKEKKHYFDYRFLSFFLASFKPERYFYVKYREYVEFAKRVDYEFKLRGSQGTIYETLSQLSTLIRSVLKQNKDFAEVHKLITSKFDYKDSSLSWGTFDFIFNIVRRDDSGAYTDAIGQVSWNSKIAQAKQEALEDIISSEEVEPEISALQYEKLVEQTKTFKPTAKEDRKEKLVNMKVRMDNARQKERIKIIENYSCQVCNFSFEYVNSRGKRRKYAEVDHIIDKAEGGTEIMGNLWVLCPNCHMRKTLGVIIIDPKKRKVTDDGKEIKIKDNHLNWG